MRTKAIYFEDWLREQLKNPELCRLYEKERKALTIAYEIARLRHRLGLSQKELARRVGTTQEVICRLESGAYTGYTIRTLERIAKATNTELAIGFRLTRRKQAV